MGRTCSRKFAQRAAELPGLDSSGAPELALSVSGRGRHNGGAVSATRLGQLLLAVAVAVLGGLDLVWGDFSYIWQPVPPWLPWKEPLADASGVVLIACGLGMLVPRTARIAALLLTANMVAWLVLIKVPAVLASPGVAVEWESLGETLILIGGAWSLLVAVSGGPRGRRGGLDGAAGLRLARLVYALAMPMMGLSHFFYLKLTASMIPAWIPFHVGFAGLTGAAHIAAGLGLLCGVLPRLAATAEAVMISLFALLANGAMVLAQPRSHGMWAELLAAAAMAGAAWAVAGGLDGAPWGLRRPPGPPRPPLPPTPTPSWNGRHPLPDTRQPRRAVPQLR
jgi:uncharacterized membrane protein